MRRYRRPAALVRTGAREFLAADEAAALLGIVMNSIQRRATAI